MDVTTYKVQEDVSTYVGTSEVQYNFQRRLSWSPVIQGCSTSSGAVSEYSFLLEEQTKSRPSLYDTDMLCLENAAKYKDEIQFAELVTKMDWQTRSVEDFLRAIQLALSAGAHLTARRLAMQGGMRFPEHSEMSKYTKILAPVKTVRNTLPPNPDVSKNMEWLRTHHKEFQGLWVALRNGTLLASADTFRALREKTGELKNTRILVTRVF